jgi:hypothetical protein
MFSVKKVIHIFWDTFIIFKKLPQEKNRSVSENSPNLFARYPTFSAIIFLLRVSAWRESNPGS